ncbi:MAG: nucleoside monophosphate kinase, partial [archaeon]|nr:nucleoside monophosphate kinase [archaeon]
MSELISKEEIETLKKRKPHLIFVNGQLSAGMKSHCKKIAAEFRTGYVEMKKLLKAEVEKNSAEGIQIKNCFEAKERIPIPLKAKLLVKEIIANKKEMMIIEGFPKNLEEALFFEKNIYPIKSIVTFNTKPETCLKIFKEKYKERFMKKPEEKKEIVEEKKEEKPLEEEKKEEGEGEEEKASEPKEEEEKPLEEEKKEEILSEGDAPKEESQPNPEGEQPKPEGEQPKPEEQKVEEPPKPDPIQEEIQKFMERFERRRNELKPLIEFYSKFGIVKELNG